MTSPDTGTRTSDYNVFGELIAQSDASSPANTILFTYDLLGRLVQRNDSGQGLTTWEFIDSSGPLLGLPSRVTGPLATVADGFAERYTYDGVGRRTAVTATIGGTAYVTNYGWDTLGRVASMIYPSTTNGARLYLAFGYTAGYLSVINQDLMSGGLLGATVRPQKPGRPDQGEAGATRQFQYSGRAVGL